MMQESIFWYHYEAGNDYISHPDENLGSRQVQDSHTPTSPAAVANYTVVNATPTDHSGSILQAG